VRGWGATRPYANRAVSRQVSAVSFLFFRLERFEPLF
jgi:hypothetical protein